MHTFGSRFVYQTLALLLLHPGSKCKLMPFYPVASRYYHRSLGNAVVAFGPVFEKLVQTDEFS